jgi:hypothetical protein
MSSVDVKSLFKSGKKTIKAFKIATGPAAEAKGEAKAAEESLEHWEAPAVAQVGPVPSVGLEEFKYVKPSVYSLVKHPRSDDKDDSLKQSVSWTKEYVNLPDSFIIFARTITEPEPEPVLETKSSYVPPSQRRAEASKVLPTLAEAVLSAPKPEATKQAASSVGAIGGPTRLKLITSATKKAMEDEARQKEEERIRKEAEKQARREQLRAEMSKQQETKDESRSLASETIKAAPLDKIYAKYIGRAKIGRKLSSAA